MARLHAPLDQVLDALEHHYGRQKAAGPTDPYEMILLRTDAGAKPHPFPDFNTFRRLA
jgi:hypothetical protein